MKPEELRQYIEAYKRDGVIVVPDLLSPEEVRMCREGMHNDLFAWGVDYNNLEGCLDKLKGIQTHQSGGLPFHYSKWRVLQCALNEKLFELTCALWAETWAISAPGFECPWAPFEPNRGYAYLDSMNFRVPSALIGDCPAKLKLQKNLAPHIDINPCT